MYQRVITDREAGQRFDKYLQKLLPNAGSGFLYKMLRKKNIVLNDKKADGSEKITCGDTVSVYFSEETLQKFMGVNSDDANSHRISPPAETIRILYENSHILIADKPAGILTQKAKKDDVSLNEWLTDYLLQKEEITQNDLQTFRPSACNRLDRNTSGIVLCAKSVQGAQMLGDALRLRSLHKFYRLYVKGHITEEKTIEGYLRKDKANNKVRIAETKEHSEDSYIRTRYVPIAVEADKTLLEVELITGKSHQIRAHLASIGHPLLGDYKYGDSAWNEKYRKTCGINYQLLHACRVVFPALPPPFDDISGRTFSSPLPKIFEKAAKADKRTN